jgi:hypothetical protein
MLINFPAEKSGLLQEDCYGVTRERIRQLEFRAMRKLRTMMGKQYQENFFIPK